MAQYREINLKKEKTVPSSASIQFVKAEVPADYRSPFAMVWYVRKGKEEKDALRLDMDKRIFLDHLDDKEDEEFIRRSAPEIASYLGSVLYATDVS